MENIIHHLIEHFEFEFLPELLELELLCDDELLDEDREEEDDEDEEEDEELEDDEDDLLRLLARLRFSLPVNTFKTL